MATHQLIQGLRSVTAGTTVLYTNSSGSGQNVTVWGAWLDCTSIESTAGTTAHGNAAITINAVNVIQVEALCIGSGSGHGDIAFSECGQSFFLPNGATIALVTSGNASFVSASCAIVCDIQTGTA